MISILVVEDDPGIVASLTPLLAREGYAVTSTSGQKEALDSITHQSFDLVLLDIALAEGNGFAVCAALQCDYPDLPIIFLTASDDEFSTVAGLDMGAVDYIAKPFRARELLSRMRAALRLKQTRDGRLAAGAIVIDPASASVMKNGRELVLSALEYRLLLYFLQNKGKLVTREQLRDAIWDTASEYVNDNSLNVYIKRLREKIEDDPTNPSILQTVRGLGWKVEN